MAKTQIAFRQIKLNSIEFNEMTGANAGKIEFKSNGIAISKLGDFAGADKVLGQSGNNSVAEIALANRHLSTEVYGNITGLGQQIQALDMGANRITNIKLLPTSGNEAASKQYVDDKSAGLLWKDSVRLASDGPETLANLIAGYMFDGIALLDGDRILLKDQAAAEENGVYVVNGAVAMVAGDRASDMDASPEFPGAAMFAREGTLNADSGWVCTSDSVTTLNTDAVNFVQFSALSSYTGGSGITAGAGTIDMTDDDLRSTKLKARRFSLVISTLGSAETLGGATDGDTGMVDAEVAKVFLNGILIKKAGASNLVGGDYFITENVGAQANILVDSNLAQVGDKVEIRYLMNA
jgi:hypothetical protein